MTNHTSDTTASDTVIVRTPPCFACSKPGSISVERSGFAAWQAGALIQHALPALSAAERELLISGTHPACWDALFPEEDE
jgi:hypothetical protein